MEVPSGDLANISPWGASVLAGRCQGIFHKETKGGSLQGDEQGTFEKDVPRAFETHKCGVRITFPPLVGFVVPVFIIFSTK